MIRKNFMICLFLVFIFFISFGISNVFITKALAQGKPKCETGTAPARSKNIPLKVRDDGLVIPLGTACERNLTQDELKKLPEPDSTIKVYISNPYCFVIGGRLYCY